MEIPNEKPVSAHNWHRELTRYHWFVLIVAALGWLFDTMDQQLFVLARVPALRELLAPAEGVTPDQELVNLYGGYATAIFLIGWASGGLFFGMLGDRIGRAKTMMLTILVYSFCTGLSALSRGFWDFAAYRFLTGLGVGGEFAVGVALVAEVMPNGARPFALGLLQALSAVGNVSAALINNGLGYVAELPIFGITITPWRAMFLIGTLPALLAVVIRRRLKEPERWESVHSGTAHQRLGSYAELFGDQRWRKRAIVGLLLATSGVIGVWGIGFFSFDLTRSVFRKVFEQEARDAGQQQWDQDLLRLIVHSPALLDAPEESAGKSGGPDAHQAGAKTVRVRDIRPNQLISSIAGQTDAQPLFTAIQALHAQKQPVNAESVVALLDTEDSRELKRWKQQTPTERAHRLAYLSGEPTTQDGNALAGKIAARSAAIEGRLTNWAGITSLLQNIGAFFGIYAFSLLTHRFGRRSAFAVSFIAAGLSTAFFFWNLDDVTDVYWMVPLMGFCLLSLFGGYAIYFPELFPTRLRSTGTSFCYNVGRFIAALGPYTLGLLSSKVFASYAEPLRYSGVTMCLVFLIGLLALPFAPETKDQPLPE